MSISFNLDKSFGIRRASPFCVFVDVHYFLAKLMLAEFLRAAEYHKIWLSLHPRNSYCDKIVLRPPYHGCFCFVLFLLSSLLTSYWFSIDGRLRPIFFRRVCFLQIWNYCGKTCLKRSHDIFPFNLG